MNCKESEFLVEAIRCSSQLVFREARDVRSDVLSEVHVRENAVRFDDTHGLDVEDAETVGGDSLSLLVDEWNKVDLSPVILSNLESQMKMALLWLLLEFAKLFKSEHLGVCVTYFCICALELIFQENNDVSFHLDNSCVVINTQLLYLTNGLSNGKIVMLSIKLECLIDKLHEEDVVLFGLLVVLDLDVLQIVVLFQSKVKVHAVLAFNDDVVVLVDEIHGVCHVFGFV